MSVALANYAASGLSEKTAYLELSKYREMAHWKKTNEEGYFEEYKIHYYPDFKREQIPILLNREYEKIIMDFGDAYSVYREEILRCDRKIFLLNLNPWQKFAAEKMADEIQNKDWGNIHPIYASVNVQKTIKKEIEKKYGIQIMEIPSINNPRLLQSEEFSCMDFMLGQYAAKAKKRKLLIPIRNKR